MSTAFLGDVIALQPGAPTTREGITLIPIFAPRRREIRLKVAGDDLVVTELPTPTVPELQVHNPTAEQLLIPAGKILSGGRQTRVVNVSIVVAPGATIVIPVSCVEAGRWAGGSRFADSRRFASRRVRAIKQRTVARNVRDFSSKHSGQGAVWSTISDELNVRSVRSAGDLILGLDTALDDRPDRVAVVGQFIRDGVQPGQVGVAVAHGDKILGVEVFPSTEALHSSWEGIVRAAVLDADEFDGEALMVDAARGVKALEQFLAEIAMAEGTSSNGVGSGTEVHVETPSYVAHGLRLDGELIYCNAFAN